MSVKSRTNCPIMASFYVNSGLGPSPEDCIQRCLGNDDTSYPSSPFFAPPPPPSSPQACRNGPLDLATLLNNAGYQLNVPNGYSIAMRGNEPVRVHVELGSPAARNAEGYYASQPAARRTLASSMALATLSVVMILAAASFIKTLDLRGFIEKMIRLPPNLEDKPRPVARDVESTATPCACRNHTKFVPARRPEKEKRLPELESTPESTAFELPLIDETDLELSEPIHNVHEGNGLPGIEEYSSNVVEEIRDPVEPRDFMFNLRLIIPRLNLEKFFPPDNRFIRQVTEAATSLRSDPKASLGTPENIRRLIRLSLYQPVIYCDDSGSMEGRRYSSQQELVKRIAGVATRIVPQSYGVELRFINSSSSSNLKAVRIDEAMTRVKPVQTNLTNLGKGLRAKILKPLVYDVLTNPKKRFERPLLVCIITDGHPYPEAESTFKDAVVECRQRLVKAGYNPTAVMFVISQIGSEQKALDFLGALRGDPEIKDVLYCTTSRLDKELEELRENEKRLDEWLLKMLTTPIMMETDSEPPEAPAKEPSEIRVKEPVEERTPEEHEEVREEEGGQGQGQ